MFRLSTILISFILTLALLHCTKVEKPAPEVRWISLADAQALSKNDHKKILVDIYTDWCEFCKKLEEQVYPDSLVRESIYEYYHAVKLDAESDEVIEFNGETLSKKQFAKKLGVRSYPTILFIDTEGELILQINGYMPAEDFKNMLVYIGEEAYHKKEFHEFIVDK
jgi:thioredoxin-related protein